MIRRGKVGKGVVDVGSAVLFAGGELGFGRWECRHISILCMAAAAAGLLGRCAPEDFLFFSPYKKNGVGELFLLVGTA